MHSIRCVNQVNRTGPIPNVHAPTNLPNRQYDGMALFNLQNVLSLWVTLASTNKAIRRYQTLCSPNCVIFDMSYMHWLIHSQYLTTLYTTNVW